MNTVKQKRLSVPMLNDFNIEIAYNDSYENGVIPKFELHTHSEIELYIGIEGDVSFLVNNKIYPVMSGDVIISRPEEYHHCICHSEKQRKFFCVWLECEQNSFIESFFKEKVTGNLVSPDETQKKELLELCFRLLEDDIDSQEKYFCFFSIFNILKSAQSATTDFQKIPEDLIMALEYIDKHISENMQISDIAKTLYISESTIERRFKEYLKIKPQEFIKKRKMVIASEMLKNGETVLSTGLAVGYSDNSYFIKLFKEFYGMTPHKYKKENQV